MAEGLPDGQEKESAPEALVRLSAAGSKSLRAELSVASAELRDKAGELSQAQLALRYAHPACRISSESCGEACCFHGQLAPLLPSLHLWKRDCF